MPIPSVYTQMSPIDRASFCLPIGLCIICTILAGMLILHRQRPVDPIYLRVCI
jgi:hypothetical protein